VRASVPVLRLCAQAVFDGQDSLLLGAIHIAMLRLVQADMEEAHASGAASVRGRALRAQLEPELLNC